MMLIVLQKQMSFISIRFKAGFLVYFIIHFVISDYSSFKHSHNYSVSLVFTSVCVSVCGNNRLILFRERIVRLNVNLFIIR